MAMNLRPYQPQMTTQFKKGNQVIMHNRLHGDIVSIANVADGLVSIAGTTAQFCAITGKQVTYPNCWKEWSIEATQ